MKSFFLTVALVALLSPQVVQVNPPVLTTPVWNDLVATAGAINPLGADGQMTEITDATGYIGCLQADAAGETAVVQWQLSHGMKDNTDIRPHVHWMKNDGVDNTGTVTFEAKFRHCPLGAAGVCGAWTAFSAGTDVYTAGDVAGAHGMTLWVMADATYDFNISDVVMMQVKRTGGTSGSVAVCSADIHYQIDSLGTVDPAHR